MTATLTWWPELDFCDQCDRCGAQALVHVVFVSFLELFFCGHHANAYEPTLMELDVEIRRSPGWG